jgi:uncharacterized membrane protein YhhN
LLNIWFWLAGGLAVTHWICRWYDWKWVGYLTKPAVMTGFIFWSWQASRWRGELLWFGMGLIFSLIGDFLLMLPERWFFLGTGAFLCTHICYFLGFNLPFFFLQPDRFLVWLPFLALDVLFWVQANRFCSKKTGMSRLLPLLGTVYFSAISLMCASAWGTFFRPNWYYGAALLAASGGLLFLISDSLLIYNRFFRHVSHAHFWIMTSYYLAQAAIMAGALLNFQ